jgi:hypothetical protein
VEENTRKTYVEHAAGLAADPLLAPPGAPHSASSLFVINLCASIAPVQVAGKTIPGFETYKLYQVARAEDGRTRHRLRLGFFTSETDAERVLNAVRENYPTAFVTSLSDDDRRFARGYLPDIGGTASWKRPTIVADNREPAKEASAPVTPVKNETVRADQRQQVAAPTKAPKGAASPPSQPSTSQAPTKSVTGRATVSPDAADVELSWDPPTLLPAKKQPVTSKGAPVAQTVAPVFKTDTVIKAKPETGPKARQTSANVTRDPVAKAVQPAPRVELALAHEPAAPASVAAPTSANGSAQPFHVGKGVEIPTTAFSLEATGKQRIATADAIHSKPAPKAHNADKPGAKPATPKAPAVPVSSKESPARTPLNRDTKPVALTPAAASPTPARVAPPSRSGDASRPVPELDSTQTIRALTSAELNDDSQEKWFAIQLAVSEQPLNLDAMPHLDIFEAYRLYSVANAGSGKIIYSLRLGFFREAVSAEAVSGYLKTFFGTPSVIRISTAEHLRFKDAPAPKTVAASSAAQEAKVIDLSHARDRKPPIPTVTMEVASPTAGDRSPTGSFKTSTSGSYKMNATGTHKALKPAAKSSPPATRRSAPLNKSSATGKHKILQPKKSLGEQLLDEAREVQLSQSAIRKLPKNDSLLSRLVDKLTK